LPLAVNERSYNEASLTETVFHYFCPEYLSASSLISTCTNHSQTAKPLWNLKEEGRRKWEDILGVENTFEQICVREKGAAEPRNTSEGSESETSNTTNCNSIYKM